MRRYKITPTNLLMAAIGLVFCFFGGTYAVLFAAIEAARLSGWESSYIALCDLASEANAILAESAKDDKKDDDGDGVSDVDQLDAKALLLRKTKLILTKCDPNKINKAMGGLWLAWMGVVATLKVQFAKTITFALSIADFMQKPVDQVLMPLLLEVVPNEYHKWVPVCLGWVCKAIAVSIAWYVQSVLSAVTTGIRGGLLFSRSMLEFCVGRGWDLGGLIPKDHHDTYIDEAVGWTLAALGVYFQVFVTNFTVPFPLNLVMWPFSLADECAYFLPASRQRPGHVAIHNWRMLPFGCVLQTSSGQSRATRNGTANDGVRSRLRAVSACVTSRRANDYCFQSLRSWSCNIFKLYQPCTSLEQAATTVVDC